MHEGLILGPVTQVLRKGELIHELSLYAVGGRGGANSQRNTVYHKILIISAFDCALPV